MTAQDRKLTVGTVLPGTLVPTTKFYGVAPTGNTPPWGYLAGSVIAGYIAAGGGTAVYPTGAFLTGGHMYFNGGTVLTSSAITEANGEATMTAGTISRTKTKNPAELFQTLTDASPIAWDMDSGGAAQLTLVASRSFGTPSNIRQGATYVLTVIQGAGTYAITWPSAVFKWPAGGTPTMSASNGAKDLYSFYSPDGSILYGNALKAFA